MYWVLAFVLGALAALELGWLARLDKARERRLPWYLWLAATAWYAWTATGIIFVINNAVTLHVQAATTGAFMFFLASLIAGVLLLRALGIMGTSKGRASLDQTGGKIGA